MPVNKVMMITREQFDSDYYEDLVSLPIVNSVLVIAREEVLGLRKGKVLAYNDGEYCHFIVHEKYARGKASSSSV